MNNRKSIRLKNYDYSRPGFYFITICTKDRKTLFGHIENNIMILNDSGAMIKKCYFELEKRFNIKCRDIVVMPNHIHCIIEIVGVPLVGTQKNGQPQGIAPTLGDIIGVFKSITTNEYIKGVKAGNWQPFNKKLWQRNYWEHIIRNKESYMKLAEYIQNNPLKWEYDELNPNKKKP